MRLNLTKLYFMFHGYEMEKPLETVYPITFYDPRITKISIFPKSFSLGKAPIKKYYNST